MFFDKILTKIFGTSNERAIKKLMPMVAQINAFEPEIKKLSDEQLREKTVEFRARIAARLNGITGEDEIRAAENAALDELLPEAFAVVREAGWRAVQMRHFDVQLIGAMVLHQGKIAEMRTGEGKTLVATLSCYLNALAGHGVHVVTVNDYLAKRDAEWMGKIYEFLGLTVGVIVHDLDDNQRRAAYASDITYGTNNEFGFDYLRDNMKFEIKDCVQRGHYYAIVDEVDSILIDEARTPLIISGPTDQTTDKYARVRKIIPELVLGDLDLGRARTRRLEADMKSILLAAAAVVLMSAGAAMAKDLPTGGMTAEDVAAWLKGHDLPATIKTADDGVQTVASSFDSQNFVVILYDCTDKRCGSLEFEAGFDTKGAYGPLAINDWNKDNRWTRAYSDKVNDPWLEQDADLTPGGTYELLDDQLGIWRGSLERFRKYIKWDQPAAK